MSWHELGTPLAPVSRPRGSGSVRIGS
jgi:hypothetical protein